MQLFSHLTIVVIYVLGMISAVKAIIQVFEQDSMAYTILGIILMVWLTIANLIVWIPAIIKAAKNTFL